MLRNTTQPRILQSGGLLAVMLFIGFALLASTVPAYSAGERPDHGVMSGARAKRIMDHGDGSVLQIIIVNRRAQVPKEEHIPVLNSPLRMDLILPIRIVEAKPDKVRTLKVRKSSRWRSNAFQKWRDKYKP